MELGPRCVRRDQVRRRASTSRRQADPVEPNRERLTRRRLRLRSDARAGGGHRRAGTRTVGHGSLSCRSRCQISATTSRSSCVFERMGASPGAASAFLRNEASIDVRPLLGLITVPTLAAHSDDTPTRSLEESRYLAAHIAGARFFEGSSTTFYWGGGVLEEIIAFVSGSQHTGQRDLATVLFTDIVDSTGSVVAVDDHEWRQTLDFLDDIVASRSTRAGGRVVKQTGDGHLVEFARPGDAVSAALAICHDAPTLGLQVRAGLHTGEIERRESGDIGGLTCTSRHASQPSPDPAKWSCHAPLPTSSDPANTNCTTAANTNLKEYPAAGSSTPSTPEPQPRPTRVSPNVRPINRPPPPQNAGCGRTVTKSYGAASRRAPRWIRPSGSLPDVFLADLRSRRIVGRPRSTAEKAIHAMPVTSSPVSSRAVRKHTAEFHGSTRDAKRHTALRDPRPAHDHRSAFHALA